ncbi:hypothetical protein BU26DRAFT_515576 [Trematosphaeria pertusa]|uniref:Uncharacterized protein n=1 Tax=Trematosphaeria pertusa TaxID=390896 RepID=A0A6A6ISD7_9PLEO|nr:uncharacterized protein BU26DRAFT_515576 [Trematosphaeria pertusa]KAF2253199.1 hypothetical protein BU26DRAFT_515576 [Trematosphaeria pertusa]
MSETPFEYFKKHDGPESSLFEETRKAFLPFLEHRRFEDWRYERLRRAEFMVLHHDTTSSETHRRPIDYAAILAFFADSYANNRTDGRPRREDPTKIAVKKEFKPHLEALQKHLTQAKSQQPGLAQLCEEDEKDQSTRTAKIEGYQSAIKALEVVEEHVDSLTHALGLGEESLCDQALVERDLAVYAFFPESQEELEPGYLLRALMRQLSEKVDGSRDTLTDKMSFEDYFKRLIDEVPSTCDVVVIVYGIGSYADRKDAKNVWDLLWEVKETLRRRGGKLQAAVRARDARLVELLQQRIEELGERDRVTALSRDRECHKIWKKRQEVFSEEEAEVHGPVLRVLFAGPGADMVAGWVPESEREDVVLAL